MSAVNYTPPPTVARFMRSEAFIRGLQGPFGSGKSVGCVMELLRRAKLQEPAEDGKRYTRFVIIRNTFRMLQDTTIKTVHEWVPPGKAGAWKSTAKDFHVQFDDVVSEWQFRALEGPDDVRNLLSMEVTGAWINEYREISPDVFINLLGRVGRYPSPKTVRPSWTGVIMDTNPPSADSFWYSLFEEDPPEEIADLAAALDRPLAELHKQPSGLSPEAENVENLPHNYYQTMLASNAGKSSEWVKVHIHGEYGFVQDGEPVYRDFTPEMHVADKTLKANPQLPLAIGLDFGLTPAAAICQNLPSGQWVILGELTAMNCGIERFSDELLRKLRFWFPDVPQVEIWADPAGQHRSQTDEKTCFQVLRSKGLRVRPGPQDLETRLGSVRRVLSRVQEGKPGVLIDPSCKTLIKGFHGMYRYRRKRTANGELEEVPEKNEVSHVHDALQYILAGYEGPALRGGSRRQFGGVQGGKPIVRSPSFKVFG